LISKGWEIKKQLSPLILTDEISNMLYQVNQLEIYGGKLLGAGAGGFIFSIHKSMRQDLPIISSKWATFQPKIDYEGARILSTS